jgi:thiamine pyrophosphokinase
VVAGGPEEAPELLSPDLFRGALVLAADGGWRLCRDLGVKATLVIGDMDTLFPEEVARAEAEGSEIRRYPADKDQSDLELAILAAHQMGARSMTLLGALGGQWDHCLLNLLAPLSLCHSLGVWARLLTARAEIYLVPPGSYLLCVQPGTRVSLAALSSRVEGLTLDGFLYPLSQASLERRQTLGLANAVLDGQARLSLASGELLLTIVG